MTPEHSATLTQTMLAHLQRFSFMNYTAPNALGKTAAEGISTVAVEATGLTATVEAAGSMAWSTTDPVESTREAAAQRPDVWIGGGSDGANHAH